MTELLTHNLTEQSKQLGKRVLDEMYENPFWQERFGERGRRKAEEDSGYHVSYLVQALSASDPRIFTKYARWLQTVLVSRGMCTRHIVENFERLARAITDNIAEAEPALAILRAGHDALRYDAGPGRELQEIAPRLVQAAVDALYTSQPSWQARFGEAGRAHQIHGRDFVWLFAAVSTAPSSRGPAPTLSCPRPSRGRRV